MNHSITLTRREGNTLFMALSVVVLLMGLATAQFAIQQKSLQQSRFFARRTELHKYAESGASLGVHQLMNSIGENPGLVGTTNWSEASDVGEDGKAGTGDAGEGDGLPTKGEPGVTPHAIGPSSSGVEYTVYTADASGGLKRVVATAYFEDLSYTVERQLRQREVEVPRVGAVWVDPNVALDLKGNKFTVDGRDHRADGSLAGSGDLWGFATDEAETSGANALAILSQIPSKNYDQVLGTGSEPSVGELGRLDVDTLADDLVTSADQKLGGGEVSSASLGDPKTDDYQVTHVNGNVHFSGKVYGAGVLVIDGNVKVTGQFLWYGLVLVRGDIVISGGGAGIHVLGSLLVTESLTAIDTTEITIAGTADVYYSTETLDLVDERYAKTAGGYENVYYTEGSVAQYQ